MKLYNCRESPNANILFKVELKTCVLDGDNLDYFRNEVIKCVKERPRVWKAINFIRLETIDADNEKAILILSFGHRLTWQDAPRILLHRSDLVRFLYEVAKRRDLNFSMPPEQFLLSQPVPWSKAQWSNIEQALSKRTMFEKASCRLF